MYPCNFHPLPTIKTSIKQSLKFSVKGKIVDLQSTSINMPRTKMKSVVKQSQSLLQCLAFNHSQNLNQQKQIKPRSTKVKQIKICCIMQRRKAPLTPSNVWMYPIIFRLNWCVMRCAKWAPTKLYLYVFKEVAFHMWSRNILHDADLVKLVNMNFLHYFY